MSRQTARPGVRLRAVVSVALRDAERVAIVATKRACDAAYRRDNAHWLLRANARGRIGRLFSPLGWQELLLAVSAMLPRSRERSEPAAAAAS